MHDTIAQNFMWFAWHLNVEAISSVCLLASELKSLENLS